MEPWHSGLFSHFGEKLIMSRIASLRGETISSTGGYINHKFNTASNRVYIYIALRYRDHDVWLSVNLSLNDIQNSGQGETSREVI